MHYYQFNIADYRKDTAHLSPIEHYIYRYLIDWYYMDEKPISKETEGVLRRLGLGSDGLLNLQNVLQDFFEETENGWIHKRIEKEISAFQGKRELARENGKKGGRPKKQQLTENEKPRKTNEVFLANPEERVSKPNHKPITNNQEEKNKQKKKNEYSEVFEKVWAQYPKREGNNSKADAYKAWQARLRAGVREDELADGVSRYAVYVRAKGNEGTEFVLQAKTFFGPSNHWSASWQVNNKPPKRNGSGTAEDIAREYQQAFGKPPPPGKTTDEVRMLLAQRRDKQQQWWNG